MCNTLHKYFYLESSNFSAFFLNWYKWLNSEETLYLDEQAGKQQVTIPEFFIYFKIYTIY